MRPVVDELDADVKNLLDRAASRVEAPEEAKRRVAARLSQAIVALPGSSSSSIAPRPSSRVRGAGSRASGTAAHVASRVVVAAFVAGAMTGAGVYALLRRPLPPRIVYVDRPVAAGTSAAVTPSPVASTNAAPTGGIAPWGETNTPVERRAAPASSRPGGQRVDNLDAERSLLDVARRALAEGRPADALAPLTAHARRFPNGVLVEEREALAINALVGSSRYEEARVRAAEFLRRFPGSLLRSSVEAAVAAIP